MAKRLTLRSRLGDRDVPFGPAAAPVPHDPEEDPEEDPEGEIVLESDVDTVGDFR